MLNTKPKLMVIVAASYDHHLPRFEPAEQTPAPAGAPKSGYMIESMVSAGLHNVKADINDDPRPESATHNAICRWMGDTGI
jgi:sulfide:quinone oxidoreductase